MALEMRPRCERCQAETGLADEAYVCSYECTFCSKCTAAMQAACPNCSGELVLRPKRRVAAASNG